MSRPRKSRTDLPNRVYQKHGSYYFVDKANRWHRLGKGYAEAMLAYAKLAAISQQKRQLLGRDKLLILTGAAACRAGWPEVAARCRELVIANNQSHLVGRTETFADAMRTEEFEPLLKRLERMCSYEKAEHLLSEMDENPASRQPNSDSDIGRTALEILGDLAT